MPEPALESVPEPVPEPAPGAMLEIDLQAQRGALALAVRLSVAGGGLALVGPNGAGKSSLLLCLLGIHRPAGGRIALGDRVLFEARRIDVPTEERGFGYVPQHYALFPHLTALDNVAFALSCHQAGRRLRRRGRRERARAVLHEMGVEHVAERMPATLSGGEAQRVALARALITEPAALLLDEPFAALDARTRPAMRELLRDQLAALGRPAIIVTHDLSDAAALASRIAVMEHGRIVQQGTLDAVTQRPATPFVAELTAGRPLPDTAPDTSPVNPSERSPA